MRKSSIWVRDWKVQNLDVTEVKSINMMNLLDMVGVEISGHKDMSPKVIKEDSIGV